MAKSWQIGTNRPSELWDSVQGHSDGGISVYIPPTPLVVLQVVVIAASGRRVVNTFDTSD